MKNYPNDIHVPCSRELKKTKASRRKCHVGRAAMSCGAARPFIIISIGPGPTVFGWGSWMKIALVLAIILWMNAGSHYFTDKTSLMMAQFHIQAN